MFVREKPIGPYRYVYLVESAREGGRTKQRIIKNLGRKEQVAANGDLDRLARSAARLAQRSMVLSLLDQGGVPASSRLWATVHSVVLTCRHASMPSRRCPDRHHHAVHTHPADCHAFPTGPLTWFDAVLGRPTESSKPSTDARLRGVSGAERRAAIEFLDFPSRFGCDSK